MRSLLLVSQIQSPDSIELKGEHYYLDDSTEIKVRLRKPRNLWDKFLIFAGFHPEYEIVSGFQQFQRHKNFGHLRVSVTITSGE